MLDPEWLRSREEQNLGWVHRVNHIQKSIKTYSYRIILANFIPETVVVRRQDARGIVSGKVYTKYNTETQTVEEQEDWSIKLIDTYLIRVNHPSA
jgi:hypothetical protein